MMFAPYRRFISNSTFTSEHFINKDYYMFNNYDNLHDLSLYGIYFISCSLLGLLISANIYFCINYVCKKCCRSKHQIYIENSEDFNNQYFAFAEPFIKDNKQEK